MAYKPAWSLCVSFGGYESLKHPPVEVVLVVSPSVWHELSVHVPGVLHDK